MKLFAAVLLLTVSLANAQSLKLRIDPAYPDQPLKTLPLLQAATPIIDVQTFEDGMAYTNLSGHSAVWYCGTSATGVFVIVTNSAAGSGYFRITPTAAQLNTNGTFWSTVLWRNASSNVLYSGTGSVQIARTTVTGNPGVLSTSIPLNLGLYSILGVLPEVNVPVVAILTNLTAGTGDITAVLPGLGLTGGAASGSATLAVSNAVVAGAAAGATALQPTGNTSIAFAPYGATLEYDAIEDAFRLSERLYGYAGLTAFDAATNALHGRINAETLAAVTGRGADAGGANLTGIGSLRFSDYGVIRRSNLGALIIESTNAAGMMIGPADVETDANNPAIVMEPFSAMRLYAGTNSYVSVHTGQSLGESYRFGGDALWLFGRNADFGGGVLSNVIIRGSAALDGGAATVAGAAGTRSLRVTDAAVSVVANGVTNPLGQLALMDVDTNAVALSRLPPDVLTSNSVAQTLTASAAPVSGAAVINGLAGGSLSVIGSSNRISFIGSNTNHIQGFGHDIAASHLGSWDGISFRIWDPIGIGESAFFGNRVLVSGALDGSDVDIRSPQVDVQAYLDGSTLRIMHGCEGASICGWLTGGVVEIGAHSPGAAIRGDMAGGSSIRVGPYSMGAQARGRAYESGGVSSTVCIGGANPNSGGPSNAVASLGLFQLMDTDNGDDTTYSNQTIYAAESIGLGAVAISYGHKQSIVVGDGLRSVGRGMMNAYGYYQHGTNILSLVAALSGDGGVLETQLVAQIAAATNWTFTAATNSAARSGGQTVSAGVGLTATTNGSAVAIAFSPMACTLSLSAQTNNVANNTQVRVPLTGIIANEGGIADTANGRIALLRPGLWEISGQVAWVDIDATKPAYAFLSLSGTNVAAGYSNGYAADSDFSLICGPVQIRVTGTNNVLQLDAQHVNADATPDIYGTAGTAYTYEAAKFLAP